VHEKVIAPAAAVTPAPKVTVKSLPVNAAVLVRAEGAVNVQVGVAGQVKPVKVTTILPAVEMAEAAVKVTDTVTAVAAAIALDKVTAPPVNTPVTATKEAALVISISALADV